jgi:hypothetical protein
VAGLLRWRTWHQRESTAVRWMTSRYVIVFFPFLGSLYELRRHQSRSVFLQHFAIPLMRQVVRTAHAKRGSGASALHR